MTLEVGNRLSYGGELCTVKFIGEIPAWPNEVALGVEWDNVSKGKHDGSYKGVRYFETTNRAKSGSFLKKSKKHDGTQTFYQALVDTYGTSVEAQEIKIGTKIVESYGFEKLQKLQSDFTYLKNISLSRKQVVSINTEEEHLIRQHLVNLTELDLSFSLISSWNQVMNVVKNLKLNRLRLVGNRFSKDYDSEDTSSLKILDLSFSKISSSLLRVIPKNFPEIEELHLSDNALDTFDESLNQIHSLKNLDLSLNNFVKIPELLKHSKINILNISDNKIQIENTELILPQIVSLDIRRNEISNWKELDQLNQIFPNLTSLRVNGNPIFDDSTADEMEMNIIARFDKLKSVNGTSFSGDKRTNAELYFISKANTDPSFDQSRLEMLAKKHKVKLIKSKGAFEDNIESKLVSLRLKYQDHVVELNTLKTIEILKLKGIISRLFKISYVDMILSYEISDVREPIVNDLSLVSSYEFENGQNIIIQKVT